MVLAAYLQVGDLERSLAFYRDGLGLEVTWNDDELAVLRGPDESAGTVVLRCVPATARPGVDEVGVTRLAWRLTDPADLDHAEERLSRHGVQYQRSREKDGDRIAMRDPDGLSIILFHPPEPSMSGQPPGFVYWYR
jgi:catechol 2,3-dioxygenase-like lactoylglutathione lyase family enzyme